VIAVLLLPIVIGVQLPHHVSLVTLPTVQHKSSKPAVVQFENVPNIEAAFHVWKIPSVVIVRLWGFVWLEIQLAPQRPTIAQVGSMTAVLMLPALNTVPAKAAQGTNFVVGARALLCVWRALSKNLFLDLAKLGFTPKELPALVATSLLILGKNATTEIL